MPRCGLLLLGVVVAAAVAPSAFAADAPGFLPGQRVLMDAHNCYPYAGLFADRIDRALASGVPAGIENDLGWYSDGATGKSRIIVTHGGPGTGKEPTLRDYFFEKIRPIVEKALKEGNKGDWPLITLNLNDLRAPGDDLPNALWDQLGEFEDWLCTAVKTGDPEKVMPLDVKPVLVLTNGGKRETRLFYDRVPVGGKLRLFGGVDSRPGPRGTMPPPEEMLSKKATNFHRWWNNSWHDIEEGGAGRAGDWTEADAARLKALVDHGHTLGYWIRFYALDGHSLLANGGWGPDYNFGSLEAAQLRWKACIEAGVDFIASDQYEDLAATIREMKRTEGKRP